jgi:hypothetical protein
MSTNQYFNHFSNSSEQGLIEDLVVESIKIYAINEDSVLNEYEYREYTRARDVEIYIKNSQSFEGQGLFLEKFGLQIEDQMVVNISKRSFEEFIGTPDSLSRPREGDCLYIPVIDALYEISYFDQTLPFYQLGSIQMYELTAKLYSPSGDQFSTGVSAIDDKYSREAAANNVPYDQGDTFDLDANNFLDFTETNPFTDGN